MPTVDYLPIATAGGANVESQGTFAGSAHQTAGFTSGLAVSAQLNKCWRQSSMMAAALANLISNRLGINVLDDGNLANLITELGNALALPTITLKRGSGSGDYTTTSGSFVDMDATNLALSVTIPIGSKLVIQSSGTMYMPTIAIGEVALFDSVAATQLITQAASNQASGLGAGNLYFPFSMNYVIVGDGALHTIKLQFESFGAGGTIGISNSPLASSPSMLFTLTASL